MKSKMNIEMSLSKNFNKITASFIEEELEYESENELKAKMRQKFLLARTEIENQFDMMGVKK